jgi:hypothetical protein
MGGCVRGTHLQKVEQPRSRRQASHSAGLFGKENLVKLSIQLVTTVSCVPLCATCRQPIVAERQAAALVRSILDPADTFSICPGCIQETSEAARREALDAVLEEAAL